LQRACIFIICIGSHDYDIVGERQKERKQAEIKDKIIKFTSNVFSDTGLIPTNFILKSPVGGTVVDLGLCPSVPELQKPSDEKTEEMAYIVMKHHISTKCYRDLANTAQIPQCILATLHDQFGLLCRLQKKERA